MWEITEILRTGIMLACSMIIIIILRKLTLYFRWNDVELNEVTDSHHWSNLDVLLKTYLCHICKRFLTGTEGRQCDNCGICSHNKCLRRAEKTQKCKETYSTTGSENNHFWITDGNFLLDNDDSETFCMICNRECCENESSLMQCCWCQRIIHTQCSFYSNLVTDECDYGYFKKFIIPPHCITPIKSIKTARKFIIKNITNPGWKNWTPVIVLANRKSGNSDGERILSYFRRILNPCQVLDLFTQSPLTLLKWHSAMPTGVRLNVLVAGGDGTVAWILNSIDESSFEENTSPLVGIIPLGTGNDLSRILGWGEAYKDSVPLSSYLDRISRSNIVDIDRWHITMKPTRNLRMGKSKSMNCYNYFSVGVDAKVAYDFHHARNTSPLYHPSRLLNQILYTIFGTWQAVTNECSGLEKRLELYLDGMRYCDMPELESVIVLNIPSWAGGVNLWTPRDGETEKYSFSPQRINDGLLEVVGIYSSFHIAQLKIGLSHPYYIGQASEVKIILKEKLPVQIDGEPWLQQPSEVMVSCSSKAQVLKITK